MKQITLFLLGLIFILSMISLAQAETITITTYYPAPYGVYSILQLYPGSRPSGTCQQGQMYYDNGAGTYSRGVYYCDNLGNWQSLGGGYWTQSGSYLYTNQSSWNVGIGTGTPAEKLHVYGGNVLLDKSGAGNDHPSLTLKTNMNVGGKSGITTHSIFGPYNTSSGDAGALYIGAGVSPAGTATDKRNNIYLYNLGCGGGSCNVPKIQLNADTTFVNGKLGIGTDTPQNTLDVEGAAVIGATYSGTNTAPTNGLIVQGPVGIAAIPSSSAIFQVSRVGTGSRDFTIGTNGRIGIGTESPGSALVNIQGDVTNNQLDGLDVSIGSSPTLDVRGIFTQANSATQRSYGIDARGTGSTGYGVYAQGSYTGVYASGTSFDFLAQGGGGTDYGTTSSIRWKKNIKPIDNALEKTLKLRGVYFDWIKEKGGKHGIGMIAEEVGKVVPEIVGYEKDGKYAIGMDYGKLTPLLVEAIKTQQKEIDSLKKEIVELKSRIK